MLPKYAFSFVQYTLSTTETDSSGKIREADGSERIEQELEHIGAAGEPCDYSRYAIEDHNLISSVMLIHMIVKNRVYFLDEHQ